MVDYPFWFFEEKLMARFFEAGGGSPARDSEMRNAINRYLEAHPIDDSMEVGYLTAEAPIGAERGRWMLRPISTNYMPLMLQAAKEIVSVDPHTLEAEKLDLARLSSEKFLAMALAKIFIVNR